MRCLMKTICRGVKVGGKRNTHKVLGTIFKVGENNNFRETGGKCTKTGKVGGNSKFVVDD